MSEIIKIPVTMSEKWLTENGFDGLYCDNNCSCQKGDLFPCGEYSIQCFPGIIKNCQTCESLKNNVCSEDYEFCIYAKPNITFDDSDAMKYILDQEKIEFEQEEIKTKIVHESVHFYGSVKFIIHFKNYDNERVLRDYCNKFHKEVYATEPEKPVHYYNLDNGDRISVIKSTTYCYSAHYKRKQDLE